MIRKIYKINATVVLFLKVGALFTELFNKLLIISINKLYFSLHIYKDIDIVWSFLNFSSETCLSKKV